MSMGLAEVKFPAMAEANGLAKSLLSSSGTNRPSLPSEKLDHGCRKSKALRQESQQATSKLAKLAEVGHLLRRSTFNSLSTPRTVRRVHSSALTPSP